MLEKSLARFTMPFEWNGEEMFIQSRAIDETGYIRPTIQALQAERGVNSIYHNNAIATWMVNKDEAWIMSGLAKQKKAGLLTWFCPTQFSFSPVFAEQRPFNLGSIATAEQVAGWDIDVRPDVWGLQGSWKCH